MKGVRHSAHGLALLALLERLQSGTDATRQDDLLEGGGGSRENTGTPGTVMGRGLLTLWRHLSLTEDAGT